VLVGSEKIKKADTDTTFKFLEDLELRQGGAIDNALEKLADQETVTKTRLLSLLVTISCGSNAKYRAITFSSHTPSEL
jgi:hypothetical protein